MVNIACPKHLFALDRSVSDHPKIDLPQLTQYHTIKFLQFSLVSSFALHISLLSYSALES